MLKRCKGSPEFRLFKTNPDTKNLPIKSDELKDKTEPKTDNKQDSEKDFQHVSTSPR